MKAIIISMNVTRYNVTYAHLSPLFSSVTHVHPLAKDHPDVINYAQRYLRKGETVQDVAGAVSLALTHAKIWSDVTDPWTAIFEDDAVTTLNVTTTRCLLHSIATLNTPAPLVYLGECASHYRGPASTTRCAATLRDCATLCNHAYIVQPAVNSLWRDVDRWSHPTALHGHPLYRYNQDVKLRGYFANHPNEQWPACVRHNDRQIFSQRNTFLSQGHHSKKCCAY